MFYNTLWKYTPSEFLDDENLNDNTYMSRDSQISCKLLPTFIMDKQTQLFGISNPKYHCYLSSVIQLFFPILRTNGINFLFNFRTEGSISICIFETTHSTSNSKDVDALKFRLTQYDIFYNGQLQQDSSECPIMLIEVFDKGLMPSSGSNNSSTGVSLSDFLVSFLL